MLQMKKFQSLILMTFLIACSASASNFYVSSTSNGNGDGSKANPWKLQQALNSPASISNPTDTVWVWMEGGVYTNEFDNQTSFNCFTKGNPNAPIIFRNYNDERVTIDGQLTYTLICALDNCRFTWFWGLEFTNSSTADRDHSNIDRLGNVYCTAENIKFINLIVHDLGSGLDSWKTAKNSETYGCIIYNIGNNINNNGNWEGHGHGMYLQNDTFGLKKIHNNIVFNTFGYGLKIWQTTTTAAIGNFDFRYNIVYNGGAASENLGGIGNNYRTHNIFAVANGPNNPIRNTVFKHNYTFSGTNTPRPPVNAFGLNYGVVNMVLDSNYLTCQTRLGYNNTPIFDASVKGNHIIAGIPNAYGYYLWGFTETDYPLNEYFPSQPNSGLEFFITPNVYEPNRSNLVVYNWDVADNVQIKLTETNIEAGDKFELINVEDYYYDVISGVCPVDRVINVPMINHTSAPVIGSQKPPVTQFPVFGAFVLRKTGSATTSLNNIKPYISTLNIYPNPAKDACKLQIDLENAGNYKITVSNISGNLIHENNSIQLSKGKQEVLIDIDRLAEGIYYVKVVGDEVSLITKLIISE